MRRMQFEHFWFIGMLVGLVIVPWTVVLTSVHDPFGAYAAWGWKPLLISNLCAAAWGVANVLYGICVVRIGAALTGAILTGIGMAVGAILPLVLKGTGEFGHIPGIRSTAGVLVLTGVAVLVVGVALTTVAGFARDQALHKNDDAAARARGSSFIAGLVMAVIAGVTSCGISLALVYGDASVLVNALKARNTGDIAANCAFWAAGILGGAAVNIIFPAWLMTRRKSWHMLASCWSDALLAAAIGTQFIIAVNLMGRGMLLLGALGASVGFGIQQAMQVLGNQTVGFASGEWRGVFGRPRAIMYGAIGVVLAGAVVLACAKALG